MLHILRGDAKHDVAAVLTAAKRHKKLKWRVPKQAHQHERALFHLPGHGFAARGVIDSMPKLSAPGTYVADVGEIALLPVFVPLAFVRRNHPRWKWPTIPRGYTSVDGVVEKRLEQLLQGYESGIGGGQLRGTRLYEGAAREIRVLGYERNPVARQECIRHYGCTCFVCGFSFREKYGDVANGFIHVHHLENIARPGGRHSVDPIKDLRPICPNCHAVAHLREPPLKLAEIKALLRQPKKN